MDIPKVGDYAAQINEENYIKVKNFYCKFPGSPQKECERQTGLSYKTVQKHVKRLREEG